MSVVTLRSCLLLALVVSAALAAPKGNKQKDQKKGKQRRYRMNEKTTSAGRMDPSGFPEELEYTMELEEHGTVDLQLLIDRSMTMPPSYVQDENGTLREKPNTNTNLAFYSDVNGHGTFACKVKRRRKSQISCEITGIVHMDNETCLISVGSADADCTESTRPVGELKNLKVPDSVLGGSAASYRKRRNTPLPEPGFKVVEILFIVDASFMQPFYDRNDDVDSAEEEADLFITMLSNEMNVYYRSLKTVTGGALDLYTYPAAFVHPAAGSDLPWIAQYRTGNTLSTNADAALRQYISTGLTSVSWDHAMTIVGLDLYEGNSYSLLGYAYLETVCRTRATAYRYSLLEFTAYDLGLVAAHELGHALGMYHDGASGNEACPTGRNIMSPSLFSVTSSTVNTYHTFSSCSATNVVSHLTSNPDCTGTHGFTDVQFREAFCSGLLGERDNSLDLQCQRITGWENSYACNSVQGNPGCYQANYISCRRQADTGSTCSQRLRFVWNGTPCGVGQICYRGLCSTREETCSSSATTMANGVPGTTTTTLAPTTRTTRAPTTRTTPAPTTTTTTAASPQSPCSCWYARNRIYHSYCCYYGRRFYGQDCYGCGSLANVPPPF